jgi:hypothetical protein
LKSTFFIKKKIIATVYYDKILKILEHVISR